jgi:hypothetical protein
MSTNFASNQIKTVIALLEILSKSINDNQIQLVLFLAIEQLRPLIKGSQNRDPLIVEEDNFKRVFLNEQDFWQNYFNRQSLAEARLKDL